MNILVDLRPLMGGKISGVEVYTLKLLEYLLKIDTENTYLLYVNAFKDQTNIARLFSQSNVFFIQTHIPNKILNLVWSWWRRPFLDRMVMNFLRRKNWMSSHDLAQFRIDLFFMPDLRLSALSKSVKKVMTVHDLSFEHYPEFFSRKTRLWYKLLRPRREISESEGIIAVSNFTARDLQQTYQLSSSRISVVYEGVEETFGKNIDATRKEMVRQKYRLPERYFLCLSTLEPRKNLERTIEAFLLFKKNNSPDLIKLVIAGQEHEQIFSELKLANAPDVILTGFIAEEDKAPVLAGAEAFFYLSLFEGFGLPLIEAMQVGVPVVTSQVSAMPEIVDDAALLVNPFDLENMAQAFHQVLKPEIRLRLQRKMAERIKVFRWEECARKTLSVFRKVVGA